MSRSSFTTTASGEGLARDCFLKTIRHQQSPTFMIGDDAIEIWKAGVAAVHGRTLVEASLRVEDNQLHVADQSFDLSDFDRVLVVGGGKFSHFMAEGVEQVLGTKLATQKKLSGLITVPDDSNDQVVLQFVESAQCRPAGINLPTLRVLQATDRMLDLLHGCDDRTLVFALISGGGSALLEKSSLPLEDLIAATTWLSTRGADIIELNSVRIAMSDVKGGQLAAAMPSGTMIGLIVSDVPGDDIRFVSSGPTVAFGDGVVSTARKVIAKFDATVAAGFPKSVIDFLNANHSLLERPEASVSNHLIGNADDALAAATAKAQSLGYELLPDILTTSNTCEKIAASVTEWQSETAERPQCVVSLGEPVVEPGEGAGQGGRNQHAVLESIRSLLQQELANDFCFLSAGTDGEDGNTSVAGALVTREMLGSLRSETESIDNSLAAYDSHTFLAKYGLIFESGVTATNVADLRVILRANS